MNGTSASKHALRHDQLPERRVLSCGRPVIGRLRSSARSRREDDNGTAVQGLAVSTPQLAAVHIATPHVDDAATFMAVVCGSSVEEANGRPAIPIGDAAIIVDHAADGERTGITAVEVDGVPGDPSRSLLNNVEVLTNPVPAAATPAGDHADVILDHVAIMVEDLESAATAWQAATGMPAELIGLHPISNGTLQAARLTDGGRMLELLSPVPGTTSAIASRMETVGEGAMALALPAVDIDTKLQDLEARDIRLIRQPPHWLVHPANPAGVLIQLTPRVKH